MILPADRPWVMSEAVYYLGMDGLKVPDRQIARWVRQGRLKAGRVGRSLRFTKQQLDAFMAINR